MRTVPLFSLALGLRLCGAALFAPLAAAEVAPAPSAPAALPSGDQSNPPAPAVPPEPPAPPPSASVQPLLTRVIQLARAKQWAEALPILDQALQAARRLGDAVGEAYCQDNRASVLGRLQRPDEARAAWQAAAAAWERAGDGPGQVHALGHAALLTADAKAAAALESQAIALAGAERKRPLAAARVLLQLGGIAYDRRQLPFARHFWTAARARFGTLAPVSLDMAIALYNLGIMSADQDDLVRANQYHEQALAIREKLVPGSISVAASLNNLGNLAHAQGDLARAKQYHQRALAIQQKLAPGSLDVADSLNNLGNVAHAQGDLAAAKQYYEQALAIREKLVPGSLDVAATRSNLGNVAKSQRNLAGAKQYYQEALAIQQKLAPGSLDVAATLGNLGTVTATQGDLAAAKRYHQQTLAIQQKLAPGSLDVANSLNSLGSDAYSQGDLAGAKQYYEQALPIQRTLAPGSLEVANSLSNLGSVAYSEGDLAGAKQYYGQALPIQQKLAPGSLDVAATLLNLGIVAESQGDLAGAKQYDQQALAIEERLAPGSLDVAASLNSLGGVAYAQGDRAGAMQYHEEALAIRQKLAPGSPDVAASLNNLGVVAEAQGDLDAAKQYYHQAQGIQEKLAPESLGVAAALGNQGLVAATQGDLAGAKRYHLQALAIQQKLAPASLDMASTLGNLGNVAKSQRNLAGAKQYYQEALAIQQKLAPGSLDVATSLNNLGIVAQRQRQWPGAEQYFRQAWQIVQQQAGAVGGDEARQAFDASTAPYAAHLLGVQLALGKPDAAFTTLEEGRAQALRQLLLQRRLSPHGVSPPLWRAYQQSLTAQNQAEQALSRAGEIEARARAARQEAEQTHAVPAALTGFQQTARRAQQQLETAQDRYLRSREAAAQRWSEVEKHAPRLFAPSLSLAEGARALPPGTLFLAFAVGGDQTHLFMLQGGLNGRPVLRTFSLALGTPALQKQVRRLRAALADPDLNPTAPARALFTALCPAEAQTLILGARRLLISPDGPLWELPFGALVTDPNGPPRYLGLEKPITFTPSLTLFARAERSRAARPQGRLTALVAAPFCLEGDGQMAALPEPGGEAEGERGVLVRLDGAPRLLPGSGAEAAQIARLYGVRPLLGRAATEAAVRRQLGGAIVVHLATHGYIHPLRAMDSGLLLSPPLGEPAAGRHENDGVLQAWEIAELSEVLPFVKTEFRSV